MTGRPKRLHATSGWSRIGKRLRQKAFRVPFFASSLVRIPEFPTKASGKKLVCIEGYRGVTGICTTELRGSNVDEGFSGIETIHPEPNESLR